MGIEEYRFLTNTMEQITDCSGQLESAKNELIKEQELLRSLRLDLENANRGKKNHIKDIQKWEDKVRALKNKTSKLPSLKALDEAKNKIDPKGKSKYKREYTENPWWIVPVSMLFGYPMALILVVSATDGEFPGVFVCLSLIILPGIAAFWFDELLRNHGNKYEEKKRLQALKLGTEMAPINSQISTIHKLQTAKRKLRELKRGTAIDLKVKKVGKKTAGKEYAVASLKNRISSLEKKIMAKWNSIAHLIPYSFALEKA